MRRIPSYAPLTFAQAAVAASCVVFLVACDNPAPGEGVEHQLMAKPTPAVVSASEALQAPDLTTTDPGTMEEAEVRKVLPRGFQCSFAYTAESPPILVGALVAGGNRAQGVTKIHGRLVEVTAQGVANEQGLAKGAVFAADGMKLEVKPDLDEASETRDGRVRWPADLEFQLEQGLHVGYRGWYSCGTQEEVTQR